MQYDEAARRVDDVFSPDSVIDANCSGWAQVRRDIELVATMDLFRAGKNQPSLKHFTDEIRSPH